MAPLEATGLQSMARHLRLVTVAFPLEPKGGPVAELRSSATEPVGLKSEAFRPFSDSKVTCASLKKQAISADSSGLETTMWPVIQATYVRPIWTFGWSMKQHIPQDLARVSRQQPCS